MNIRTLIRWSGLALVAVFGACKDSTTNGPRPSLATATDTLPGGGGGPGNQTHFVANGDFGYVNWFGGPSGDSGSFTFGSLSVNRGGSVTNPQAFLSYFVEECDPFVNCVVVEGFGAIPAQDVSGGGKQLRLSTNTSGNPTFFTFGGSPGVITVDWSASGVYTQRSSGTNEVTFPGFRQHQTGVSTSVSAYGSGNVVGIPIPARSPGQIGTNQNVTIDILH